MSLFIASLNSGSNGNCYYIGNGYEAVLIDAGISCKETEKRMLRLGLEMNTIKAIFISHEHSDHITGIKTLSKKYDLPIYITGKTHTATKLQLDTRLVKSFAARKSVQVGELSITAFAKNHDASDPHSFIVNGNGVTIGVFTDIGFCCERVTNHFSQCNAVFLEANYCEDMLMNGDYPWHLKRRISSDLGHLSNRQALDLFQRHRHPNLSHLILSHLSRHNNTPELVERIFSGNAGNTRIVVASRYEETAVFRIEAEARLDQPVRVVRPRQLTLF